MHRALNIPEIVDLIITKLSPSGKTGLQPSFDLPPPTLLGVGLTCHAFLEPALDCIWRVQDGMDHLMKCLPEDIWLDSASEVLDLRVPTRSSNEQDWYRFDYYAKRVNTLRFNTRKASDIYHTTEGYQWRIVSESLLCWLVFSRPNQQLFPNLSILLLPYLAEEYYSVHLLLTRSLRHLDIDGIYIPDDNHMMSILSQLSSLSPHLQVLIVCFAARNDIQDTGAISQSLFREILPSLKSLTFFRCTRYPAPVPLDDYIKLTYLPDLAVLSLIDSKPPLITVPATAAYRSAQHVFSTLHSICLDSDCPLDGFLPIFSLFHFPNMKLIALRPTLPSDWRALNSLAQYIRDGCSHKMLENIEISTGGFVDANPSPTIVPSSVLQQFFCFNNLSRFELASPMHIQLDDAMVEKMTTAWPRLELLALHSPAPFDDAVQRMTLRGLAHLARCCPRLEWLTVNARVCDEDVFLPDRTLQNLRLRGLTFHQTPVLGDPLKIGAFLYALFPKTRISSPNDTGIVHSPWELVREAVYQCRRGLIDITTILQDSQAEE